MALSLHSHLEPVSAKTARAIHIGVPILVQIAAVCDDAPSHDIEPFIFPVARYQSNRAIPRINFQPRKTE